MQTLESSQAISVSIANNEVGTDIMSSANQLAQQPMADSKLNTNTNTYTLSEHKTFVKQLDLGQVSAQELQANYERAVSSEESLKAELRKLKVPELKYLLRGSFYRSDKKENLVKDVYENLLMNFLIKESFVYEPFSEKYSDALRRQVYQVTDEQIQQRTKKLQARQEFLKKSLSNPETKEEFQIFIQYRGEAKLSDEQKIVWDEIQAGRSLEKKEQELARKAVIAQVDLGATNFEMVKHFHTNRNHDVFIVTMSEKVDRATFEELCQKARRLGGNYQRAWKDRQSGSISPSGFMFNDEEHAKKFMQLKDGSVSKLDEIKAHQEEVQEAAVERLQEKAEKLEEQAQELITRPRLVNTIRRVGMAASAEKEANKNLALAQTIKNVTEGINENKLKFLNNVKAKTHFELLERLLIMAKYHCGREKNERWDNLNEREPMLEDVAYARYPHPRIDARIFKDALELAEKLKGCNLLAKRLKKWYFNSTSTNLKDEITLYRLENIAPIRQLISKLKGIKSDKTCYYAERLSATLVEYDRLQSMNITDEFVLRAALREYLEYRNSTIKPDPIKQMERDLIGRNIPGYFPTPRIVVERMLELAQIEVEKKVLEPSAGKANIADLIREYYPGAYLSVIEINESLRQILTAKGHNLVGNNFLEHKEQYSYIIMNPPFEDGQDQEHLRHAYDLLYPGGRVVAIMCEGTFSRSDKKAIEFRNWFESVNGYDEKLPNGAFLESERSTGVATRIVVIDKPSKPNTDSYTGSDYSNYNNFNSIASNTNNESNFVLGDRQIVDAIEVVETEVKVIEVDAEVDADEQLTPNKTNNVAQTDEVRDKKLTLVDYLNIEDSFLEHQGKYIEMAVTPSEHTKEAGLELSHIYHAYNLLAYNGTLITMLKKPVFVSMDEKHKLFRKWLRSLDGVTYRNFPNGDRLAYIPKTTLF
jgi:hypothetical protein